MGVTPIFLLVVVSLYKALELAYAKDRDHQFFHKALFFGVFLTAVYGLYEFNLNYLIVWILFWSSLGTLTGLNQLKNNNKNNRTLSFFTYACLMIIGLFVTLSIAGMAASLMGKDKVEFFLTPFKEDTTLRYINTKSSLGLSTVDERLPLFFYKQDPEVLFLIAEKINKYFNEQVIKTIRFL